MTGFRQPLSREELTEWMTFWQLEPFGAAFDEYLAALQAAITAEVNRDRKKRSRAFGAKDFMQDWDKAAAKAWSPDEGQSAEQMLAFVQSVQAAIEVKAGLRSPEDLQKPTLVDPFGRPIASGARE